MVSLSLPSLGGGSTQDIRRQWLLGALIFLVMALAVGLIRTSVPSLSLYLWGLLSLLALFAVRQAFPDVWNYSVWLLVIYLSAAGGVLFFFQFGKFDADRFRVLGFLLLMISMGIATFLVLHIKRTRDDFFQDSDVSTTPLPLGIWTVAVMMFWFLSHVSTGLWAWWAQEGGEGTGRLVAYAIVELVMVILALYILWIPQEGFSKGEKPHIEEMLLIPTIPLLEEKPKPRTTAQCPICQGDLDKRTRFCPECQNRETFLWCHRCEEYMVPCPGCSERTPYGRPRCMSCGKPLGKNLSCTCGRISPLSEWDRE